MRTSRQAPRPPPFGAKTAHPSAALLTPRSPPSLPPRLSRPLHRTPAPIRLLLTALSAKRLHLRAASAEAGSDASAALRASRFQPSFKRCADRCSVTRSLASEATMRPPPPQLQPSKAPPSPPSHLRRSTPTAATAIATSRPPSDQATGTPPLARPSILRHAASRRRGNACEHTATATTGHSRVPQPPRAIAPTAATTTAPHPRRLRSRPPATQLRSPHAHHRTLESGFRSVRPDSTRGRISPGRQP